MQSELSPKISSPNGLLPKRKALLPKQKVSNPDSTLRISDIGGATYNSSDVRTGNQRSPQEHWANKQRYLWSPLTGCLLAASGGGRVRLGGWIPAPAFTLWAFRLRAFLSPEWGEKLARIRLVPTQQPNRFQGRTVSNLQRGRGPGRLRKWTRSDDKLGPADFETGAGAEQSGSALETEMGLGTDWVQLRNQTRSRTDWVWPRNRTGSSMRPQVNKILFYKIQH